MCELGNAVPFDDPVSRIPCTSRYRVPSPISPPIRTNSYRGPATGKNVKMRYETKKRRGHGEGGPMQCVESPGPVHADQCGGDDRIVGKIAQVQNL